MAEERVERRLAAIMCADVVGYSRLMGIDDEGTLATMKAHRRDLIDPTIALHQGRIVKTTGDGMLIEFASVVDAVRCAVAVQQGMAERNADTPEDRRVILRAGINLGDIIVDGGDIFGDGVNVAARLETLAEPGTICISSAVREQVADKLDLGFADLGEHEVKNIARPIHVFRVEAGGGAAAAAGAALAATPHGSWPSIAVLPFTNMSGDAEQDYFADGMAEDIITGLSHIKWINVIARNSSFTYKAKVADVKQIGRELDVRYVLEGSVRKAGNRVRVTGQLVEAATGSHLWAERYDRPLDDVFALQDELTMSVVAAIEPNIRRAEIERSRRKRPDNLDAYDLILRGVALVYTSLPEDAAKAIPLLERALALEPGLVNVHGLLAWCYENLYIRTGLHAEHRAAALAHAHAALERGSDDANTIAIGGFVVSVLEHDVATALEAFDRALALSPSSFLALAFSAIALAWLERAGLAVERAERALRLSPFDPLSYVPRIALALTNFLSGNFEAAAAEARRAVLLNPNFVMSHLILAAALCRLGRDAEAKAAAAAALGLEPRFTIGGFALLQPPGPAGQRFSAALRDAGLPA